MSTQIVGSEISQKTPKPKHSLLPVLVALFIVSYGILTMLVVEQGRTIDAQRGLIRDLFSDSSELIALKGKLAQKAHAPAKNAPTEHIQVQPSAPAHSQAAPQDKNGQGQPKVADETQKLRKASPMKPPKAQQDDPDIRRMNVSI